MVDSQDVATPKEKEESSTQKRKRGPTEMKEITRARSEGQKLVIEYNELGQAIGQNATKLKIIGTTVRFHIPITYSDWPTVPKEIKDKIFELIEAGFEVDPRSKKTIIQTLAYAFINSNFKKKSENGKEKRKKHKYNHKTSRKGYENLMEELKASSSDQIDRSIVWKQARMDRKGQIPDEETKEVVGVQRGADRREAGRMREGHMDASGFLFASAIDLSLNPEKLGRYNFHTATQQKTNEKKDENATSKEHDRMAKRIKELEDKLLKMKEKDDFLGDLKEEPGQHSEGRLGDGRCDVRENEAFETKDQVVAWGTIIDSDVEGDNVKVAVDVVVDGNCAIPIPSKQGMYKMSQEVGSHILWPRDLVITDNIKMDYGEFTKDMTTFAPTPIQNALVALRFLLRMDFTSIRPIATACLDAYIMYLYTHMESSRTLNLYKFVDAGSISCGSSKEERAQLLTARLLGTDYDQLLLIPYNFGNHWTLVLINLTKGAAFWIDPLKNRIDPDITEAVERSFNIMNKNEQEKTKLKGREATMENTVLEENIVAMFNINEGVVDHEVLLKCVVDHEVLSKCCVVDKKVLLKCVVDYEVLLKCFVDHEVLLKCCVVHHEVNVMCLCG
ncbi:uncharacterized protein E6C27_scaffold403G00780 [Cucumis melo var. makuwa]|uniref:Ubiquitin-like protease family profile domain-containing protein n=1 Tax=Cucumis melo var. makuwa TaxID=1194695 RepID=A0A5A7SYV3_CUCMM|nr:uncharacterized protein E6C27_scaffold403G00780 [Cucumis melo var. makuwa]